MGSKVNKSGAKDTVRLGPWALNKTHHADCAAALRQLPDDCIDIAITSPPYWGQRGSAGIGAESDPRDYVRGLVGILAEVMRCLKPSGTLWLNIGDSYNTPINWQATDYTYSTLGQEKRGLAPTNSAYTKNRGRRRAFVDKGEKWLQYGNLLAVPWRVVLGLCDLGFLFRGEVIWSKARAMPEGRCRRPHRKHEGIYILAKDERHAFRTAPPVGTVWQLIQSPNKTPHCSTFPVDLPLQCIDASGQTGGVVLDPFMGSGTTGLAARLRGFDFLGFELDQENCRVAAEYVFSVPRALFS
ncbi:MAG: site-specific DNA-methyltransferase [Planctomycetaceae bacterium]|nr:site-specific DNA-methyltransferase [Planctomycetaceae bacterium]